MTDQLNRDEEDLLQSALETAFQPASLRRVSVAPPSSSTPTASDTPQEPPSVSTEPVAATSSTRQEEEEQWKREYEAQVSEWRARSAEQREKAEETRKMWEEMSPEEREKVKEVHRQGLRQSQLSASSSTPGAAEKGKGKEDWENVSVSASTSTQVGTTEGESPSVADARDLVTGESQGSAKVAEVISVPQSTVSSPPETVSAIHDRNSGSGEKWEDVPVPSSMTSSYPSLSYPSDPHSPVSSQPHRPLPHHTHHHTHHEHRHGDERAPPPTSTTAAIFDASLSPKTRTLALISSLAINLLLPFVNGVMLGFGEIFARNVVVKWFGWEAPAAKNARTGRVATSVGVNASTQGQAGKVPWRS